MTRHLSRLALILLALLTPACSNSRISVEKFQQLQPDQPEAQATEILGPPTQVAEKDGERKLTWSHRNLVVTAYFRDGKLTRREGTLDGLPLVGEVAKAKDADEKEAAPANDEAEAHYPTAAMNTPKRKYKDIHTRLYACQTTVLTYGAEEGSMGFNVKDAPTDGSGMAGLVVHLDRHTVYGEYVSAVQAIELNIRGHYVKGTLLGTTGRRKVEIEAKNGYLVSSIQIIRDKERYYGFSLTFMAISGDKLDERKEYASDHVGGKGPKFEGYDAYV